MRAYTVKEIDQMRAAIERRIRNQMTPCPSKDINDRAEQILRTYMVGDVDPAEVCELCGDELMEHGKH